MRHGLIAIVMFAVLALFAPFWAIIIGPWMCLMAILAVPMRGWRTPPPLALAVYTLVAWAGVSMLWTIQPLHPETFQNYSHLETFTALKLVLLAMAATSLIAGMGQLKGVWRTRAQSSFCLATAAMGLILMFEGLDGARLYAWATTQMGETYDLGWRLRNVGQGGFVYLLLLWPLAHVLIERTQIRLMLLAWIMALTISLSFGRDAQVLALAVSTLVYAAIRVLPRGSAVIVPVIAAFLVPAVMGVLLHLPASVLADLVPASWAQRLVMWDFAVTQTLQSPLIGLGLDSSRAFRDTIAVAGTLAPEISLHPHNMILQLWLELGAVGAFIFALACMALAAMVRDLDKATAAMVAATFSVWFIIGNLSFGIWQEWWIGAAVMTVVAARLAAHRELLDNTL
jgi:O-antigen ligase